MLWIHEISISNLLWKGEALYILPGEIDPQSLTFNSGRHRRVGLDIEGQNG